jgi:beta-fructofuranosidase
MMGTEGGNTTFHTRQQWGLWNEGRVTRRANGSVQFTPIAGGAIDSGLLYAVTSFEDTKNNRRVQWGWANEEMNDFAITQQGFQGAFAIPREMYVKKTTGLVNADGQLTTLGNNHLVQHNDGTFTAYTLGARPLPEIVAALRNGADRRDIPTIETFSTSRYAGAGASHMEIVATFRNFTGPAGLTVASTPDREEYTTIYFEPSNNTINVDRSSSSTIKEFANYTVTGYFYPYTFAAPGSPAGNLTSLNATYGNSTSGDSATVNTHTEHVEMHIYLDGSLLEVLVNVSLRLLIRTMCKS